MRTGGLFRGFSHGREGGGEDGLARGADRNAEVADLSVLDIVHPAVDEDIGERTALSAALGGFRDVCGGERSVVLSECEHAILRGAKLRTLVITESAAMRATPALTFSSTSARKPAGEEVID